MGLGYLVYGALERPQSDGENPTSQKLPHERDDIIRYLSFNKRNDLSSAKVEGRADFF